MHDALPRAAGISSAVNVIILVSFAVFPPPDLHQFEHVADMMRTQISRFDVV